MVRKRNKGWKRSFELRDEDTETNENNHLPNERVDDILNEQNQDDPIEYEQNGEEENIGLNIRKKVRGPTLMARIWGRPKGHPKEKVTCNQLGQPIGPTKSTFVEFLGSVARNGYFAPLDPKNWRHMPKKNKDAMIDIVKEKFDVPPGMDYWMLQFIGHRWRNWKTDLKARHYDENAPLDFQNQAIDSRVVEDQWKKLIKYWKTDAAIAASKRNKLIRKKKKMHHRTGKKSFAQIYDEKSKDKNVVQPLSRVEMFKACYLDKNKNAGSSDVANVVKEMDERSSQLPSGFVDEIAPDDVFAQVIGKDRNGRVRMMGGGVAPSDLWDNFPSRGSNYRMAMEYKAALERSEERYSEQAEINKKLMDELVDIRALINQQTSNPSVNTSAVRSSSSVQKHAQTSRPLQVNGYVAMKSCFDASKTVAEGYLQSLDPTCVVGGQMLGKNSCSILIQVAVVPSEELFRPFDMFETIGDIIGLEIAWPKHLVFTMDED